MKDKINNDPKMTAGQLIEALKHLDPNAPVLINIMQCNKAYGVIQLPISTTVDKHGYEFWVKKSFGGSITIHLPKNCSLVTRKAIN